MTGWRKRQVIDMAREAGFVEYELEDYTQSGYDIRYERFAELVRADERERLTDAAMKAAEKAVDVAMALEREACAKIAEAYRVWDDTGMGIAAAIRARGEKHD